MGQIIFEIIIDPIGTRADVINNDCIGIPRAIYPAIIDTDINPIPDTKTSITSESVIIFKYFATSIGESVCPKNIFATATKDSTSDVLKTFPITQPIFDTINPKIPT